jgi:hypothetical protein
MNRCATQNKSCSKRAIRKLQIGKRRATELLIKDGMELWLQQRK